MKRRFIALFLAMVTILSMGAINASAAAPSFEDGVYAVADKYGFEVEYIQHEGARQATASSVVPVASFDTIEDFADALENGDFQIPSVTNTNPLPIEVPAISEEISTGSLTRASGSGNRNLGNITLGLDLCATISYTYNTINSQRYYTSFTDFSPYFSGLNIGYSFDLTTWSGTVCSDISYSNGQWYYTSASSGRGYYINWGGNLKWGVEVGGVLIGMSDYIGSWFIGMGDFSNE